MPRIVDIIWHYLKKNFKITHMENIYKLFFHFLFLPKFLNFPYTHNFLSKNFYGVTDFKNNQTVLYIIRWHLSFLICLNLQNTQGRELTLILAKDMGLYDASIWLGSSGKCFTLEGCGSGEAMHRFKGWSNMQSQCLLHYNFL